MNIVNLDIKEDIEMMEWKAQKVLENVEGLIKDIDFAYRRRYRIDEVCNDIGIFDWWRDTLSLSQLKDMRKFLKEAIKLGYTGYVCFKVGSTGCANGMWAHKNDTTDGYSPEGDCLYKSFTPEYNYWQVQVGDEWLKKDGKYDSIKTIKQLEDFIGGLK